MDVAGHHGVCRSRTVQVMPVLGLRRLPWLARGRASVNDMKRVEVQVLMEIAQLSEDNGGFYGFSRKTLAERVGVSPYRARAAIERLESEDIIEVVSRYSDDGGQLANGICLTERGEWYLEGIRAGMLVQDLIKDEVADR